MQECIAWHSQISIQPTIRDQLSNFASISKNNHAHTETTGGYSPEHHNISTAPIIDQWKLLEVVPPEEEPQSVICYHGDNLDNKCRTIFHRGQEVCLCI